jgi:hypothetical protein
LSGSLSALTYWYPPVEDRRDDAQSQGLGIDGREILDRRAIDQCVGADLSCIVVQRLCQAFAPPVVQRRAFLRFQAAPHLQPVGFDRVERPQQTVEPGKNPQMRLGVAQGIGVQRRGLQPRISVAGKGEDGGTPVCLVRAEAREAIRVQARQFAGNSHERHELLGRQPAGHLGKGIRIRLEPGLAHLGIPGRPVQSFCRRNDSQHAQVLQKTV